MDDMQVQLGDSQGDTQKWIDATFQSLIEWLRGVGVEIGNLGGTVTYPDITVDDGDPMGWDPKSNPSEPIIDPKTGTPILETGSVYDPW